MSAKSSAKSSRSSIRSTSPISSTTKSGTKAVNRGVKRIKKQAENLVRPLKRAKHALSNVSTPVVSDLEDDPTATQDNASVVTDGSPEVIAVDSDDEDSMNALKEELGMPNFFFSCDNSLSLVSILSSCTENLEVPSVFILQARSNRSHTQRPCRPLLYLRCQEMQE